VLRGDVLALLSVMPYVLEVSGVNQQQKGDQNPWRKLRSFGALAVWHRTFGMAKSGRARAISPAGSYSGTEIAPPSADTRSIPLSGKKKGCSSGVVA